MNIQEFYDSIDESYENVSSRMMGNQKLVEKFVRKFLDDPTYEQIKEAVNKMDYDEILRTTHTMKGIASNLEFTHLQQKSAKAVDMIRATKFYLGLVLIGGYAVAAMVGGYTGLKDGNTQEGCKRCFYVSLVLIAITIATIILNVVFKAYSVTQFEALIIPVLFMLFTILNGRKNL